MARLLGADGGVPAALRLDAMAGQNGHGDRSPIPAPLVAGAPATDSDSPSASPYPRVPESTWSTAPRRRSNRPRTSPTLTPGTTCLQKRDKWVAARTPRCAAEDRHGTDRGFNSCHIESTRAANRTNRAGAESDNRRSQVVPPAGFEPALPPPETGRSRDRGGLLAFYLGFVFASCDSGGPWCAVVRSTRHSTPSVLSGRVRDPRAPRGQESLAGRGRPRSWA